MIQRKTVSRWGHFLFQGVSLKYRRADGTGVLGKEKQRIEGRLGTPPRPGQVLCTQL